MSRCSTECTCGRHRTDWKVGRKQSPDTIAKRAEKNKISRLGKRSNTVPAAGFYITEQGYRMLTGQIHPLSHRGELLEHRKALYDAIGAGPHECHWHTQSGCGHTRLEWGGKTGIIADHLDGNRFNNDPQNLVPACNGCNRRRSSPINGWTQEPINV